MRSDAEDLEILVAKIQKQLAPDAEVIHNAKLDGRNSRQKRQIDVLVRQKIGQYEMMIVLDCKDYARPVDVKGVEEFHGLIDDVGANKGALVCPKGFTEAAKQRAAGWQIDLYSPIDTDAHKWQVRVTAPVVCDYRSAAISFGVSVSVPKPFMIKTDFFGQKMFDSNGKELGSAVDTAIENWNSGKYPIEVGEHQELNIFDTSEVMTDNGYGELIPTKIYVSLYVKQKLYFANVPISQISGFKDELSGGIITNAFTVGIFDPDEVIEKWQEIDTIENAPARPVFTLQGLVGWGA